MTRRMRLLLLGDGESPHLLKWARALQPRVDLWAASSRGFLPEFDTLLGPERRLALATRPRFEGGNVALLKALPRLARWMKHEARPDWVHAHYLTSHGTLAWAARALFGLRYGLVATAWGSDILVAPERSRALRWLTRRVLRAAQVCTSDAETMAERMRALGAAEVLLLRFGLEAMPPLPQAKDDTLFFANRGLEPIYAPQRVLQAFAAVAAQWPQARMVVANDGSLRPGLQAQAAALGLGDRVRFVGRLDAAAQAQHYAQARWYLSLPESDAVSVSVLEAMAHGCVPLLSDLPANRELIVPGETGLIVAGVEALPEQLQALLRAADGIAQRNHAWVREHAQFGPEVERLLARLERQPLRP